MEYNTQRDKLVVPEYGRNVQKMVDICMTMEDREKRNAYAKSIIVAMSQVNPKGKDSPHYLQTLWDHLFIISDYKLDVDSPYEKPTREERDERPEPLKYKTSSITYRPYGAYLEKMIKRTIDLPEGEEKKQLIERTAHEMKKLYLQWNIDTCDDEVLKKHFEVLSEGKLTLPEDFQFKNTRSIIAKPKKKKTTNSGQKKK
ncbi:MAG: DUF4290 domain-containing protein [Bacteroidales bacterium]|nr:DUF4290 domain-containing protein [Candidatus Scybalousia scybalohippi]